MSFPNCSTIGIRRYKVFPGQDTKLSFSETPISSKLTRMDHSFPSLNFSPLNFTSETMKWNTSSSYLTPEDMMSQYVLASSASPDFVLDVAECGTVESGLRVTDTIAAVDESCQFSTEGLVALPASAHPVFDVEQCHGTQTTYQNNGLSEVAFVVPSLLDQPNDCVSSVSTKFGPGFEFRGVTPDMQLVSWDSVLFHVHRDRLLEATFNGFDGLLCVPEPRIVIPETSNLLNIILHAIYGISCSPFQPGIDTLMDAVCLFPKYGLQAKDYISPSLPLFNDIRYRMPLSPLLTFVVSSNHGLEDLAVLASAHLLGLDISTMSDNMVETINPVYLKRLFDLQTSRVNAFKRLLSVPPESHPATPECDFIAQKSLTRSWTFYTAYMLWDVRADMTAGMIERTFETLDNDLLCSLCKNCLRKRVKSIVIEWSELKRTI